MRSFASAVIGLAMATTGYAQTNSPAVEFQPIPDTIPGLLIDPAPLSGTLLRPLSQGSGGSAPLGAAANAQTSAAAAVPAGAVPAEATPTGSAPAGSAVAITSDPVTSPEPPPEPAPKPAPGAAASLPAPQPDAPASTAAAPKPAPAKPAAPAAGKTTITVIVEGVESSKGVVNVAVCDKDLSEEGCPHSTSVKASSGFVEARFDKVPPGNYAVVGYHDENGNDEFDKFLGVPREPYALSNRAGEKMVPTFKDAALKIKQGENTVIIRLQRLLGS